MKLTVLGSSSSGNCYLLHNNEECLVIEAGISFKEVKNALDFSISKIVGVLVSHEHGDHAKYVKDYFKVGIGIYASKGTYAAMKINPIDIFHLFKHKEFKQLGNFGVTAFSVNHDAVEPLGFYVFHPECGFLLFATDTYYIDFLFKGLNHILVECNYEQSILDENYHNGIINKSLRDRTIRSHFELQNVKNFLQANSSNRLKNIILLHLSDRNSSADRFKREIEEITGIQTYIADKGVEVDLRLYPF